MTCSASPTRKSEFLERRVAAPDDHELLGAAVEGPVARGAEVDAQADEAVLAVDPQAAVPGARGHDRDVAAVHVARRSRDRQRPHVARDRDDLDRGQQLDPVALGVCHEAPGELGAADALGEAGVVVDPLRRTRLPAKRAPLDDERLHPLASRVDGGRETCGPATEDDHVVGHPLGHELQAELRGKLRVRRLEQVGAIVEDDRRNRAPAVLELLHVATARLVCVDVDPAEHDPLLGEERLAAAAIGAPRRPVDGDPIHVLLALAFGDGVAVRAGRLSVESSGPEGAGCYASARSCPNPRRQPGGRTMAPRPATAATVTCARSRDVASDPRCTNVPTQPTPLDPAAALAAMTPEEKVALLSGRDFWSLNGVERLGVPPIVVTDGPYGLRKAKTTSSTNIADNVPATCFPTSSALAATWNPRLVEEVGSAIGREAAAEGVSVVLGPGANIKRTPLCGRNFEYFSEDPHLSARLAAAWIRGVQAVGVGASLKHVAANNQETRRMTIDALVDERALREIYLASFEQAVTEGHPWTVMAAYNRLNGTYCTEHRELLTDILRAEWGFDGAAMSDWGAVSRRGPALEAGLDLAMPGFGGRGDAALLRALAEGRLSAEAVDAGARRILELVTRTAAAREPGRTYDRDAHHELARRAAEEAVVVLKNDGLLPLDPTARVLVAGAFAKEPRFQGAGSSMITPHRLDDAWSELAASRGEANLAYAPGYRRDADEVDAALLAEARRAARSVDVVLAFVGLTEAAEIEGIDRGGLRLPAAHDALVGALLEVNPRVVVVLASGAPVEMPWAVRAPAIVEGYLGGQAGGSALARVLLGAAEPGGRLAETFPVHWADNPVHELPAGPRLAEYRESVYVGYRYYDSAGVDVLFPFGHGLAYTMFAYSDLAVREDPAVADGLVVSVTVTNTGARAGWEVVQVYVRDVVSGVFRPEQELRGFGKVWLAAGESTRVEVPLGRRAFAYWDASAHGWAVEGGQFEIRVGASSRDIRGAVVVDLPGDAGHPAAAEPEAVRGTYRLVPGRGFDRAAFEALYGRPLPDDTPELPGHYTLNTPLADMHSPVAGLLGWVLRRQALAFAGGDPTSLLGRIISAALGDMTLRMFPMMTGGSVDGRLLDGLLLLVNGRYGLGLRTVVRAALAARGGGGDRPAGRARGVSPRAAAQGWTDGYVQAGARRIHYERTGGEKPPIVFNHGAMDDGLCWTRVVREIEGAYDCVMVDARGHGRSDSGNGDYSAAARAADLAAVIEALGLDRPIVGGHSMGADTAINLAATRPELVRGVFLEDPPLLTPGEPVFGGEMGRRMGDAGKVMARFMSIFRYLPAGAGRALARRISPSYPDVEIRPWVDSKRRLSRDFLRTMSGGGVTMETSPDTLRQVTAPVLLIIGDRDAGSIVSEEIAADAAASMPNLQVIHLAGANHDIRRARFDGYMEALRGFLERTSGRPGTV